MSAVATEALPVPQGPLRWWQLLARRERRLRPLPAPAPGELYVQYLGDRDPWGNVRHACYWSEPWAVIGKGGVTAGTTMRQFYLCDDRMSYVHWLTQYERIVDWPSGRDVTQIIEEELCA